MFDLPVTTERGRKEYNKFRKYLIKSGYVMMQESIYSKLAPNDTAAETLVDNLKKNKPADGLVQVLKMTEKQYAKIEYVVGEGQTEIINTDARLIFL